MTIHEALYGLSDKTRAELKEKGRQTFSFQEINDTITSAYVPIVHQELSKMPLIDKIKNN